MQYLVYVFVKKYAKHKDGTLFSEEEVWDEVFRQLHCFPWELEQFYFTAPIRHFGEPVFFQYDDIQRTLGKDKSKDNYVRGLRDRLTTARRQLAVFIATAPDIGEICYPFRYFFNFEIKVPQRGRYEVQRIKKWTDFQSPYVTRVVMPRTDWKVGMFPKLPYDVQTRYDGWRDEGNRRFDEGEAEWRLKSMRNVLSEQAKGLLKMLIKKGSYERVHIAGTLGMQAELKMLKNTGMVEVFGDTVVPTNQARKMIDLV